VSTRGTEFNDGDRLIKERLRPQKQHRIHLGDLHTDAGVVQADR